MPFKSEKQRRYMWANEPDLALEWTERYGSRPRKSKRKSAKKRAKQRGT